MRQINNPNLPEGRVVLAAINAEANEAIDSLSLIGIETQKIIRNPALPTPVGAHADLQVLHLGGNLVLLADEHLFKWEFTKFFKISKIKQRLGNKYPQDVRLNCTIIGNKLLCNPVTIAPEILRFAEEAGLTVIRVKQGYARCSVCVVNENAIITDDKSVFAAAGKFLNDVVLISKGSIELKGYNYGFIGGCCGKIDKDIIAFNGELESHSDYKIIMDCLQRNNIKCIELKKGRLCDIGGILPLCEE